MESFPIKPRPGVQKFAPRDPVPVRETAGTGLDSVEQASERGEQGADHREQRHEHGPSNLIADPESRDVINRENDIRAHPELREHPDQALLRQRAYRPAGTTTPEPPSPTEPHANLKA
jgi:hypothetical protein